MDQSFLNCLIQVGARCIYVLVGQSVYRSRWPNDGILSDKPWIKLEVQDSGLIPLKVIEDHWGRVFLLLRDQEGRAFLYAPESVILTGIITYRRCSLLRSYDLSNLRLKTLAEQSNSLIAIDQKGDVFSLNDAYYNKPVLINTDGIAISSVLTLKDALVLRSTNGEFHYIQSNKARLHLGDHLSGGRHLLELPKEVARDQVKQVVGYDEVLFILDQNGLLYSKGNNCFGQLGMGEVQSVREWSTPVPVPHVKKVATNGTSSFLITEKGNLYGCGFPLGLSKGSREWVEMKAPEQGSIRDLVIGANYLVVIGKKTWYTRGAKDGTFLSNNNNYLEEDWNELVLPL